MSEPIKRFDMYFCDGDSGKCHAHMSLADNGDYVEFADHARVIAEKDEVIQKMALIIQAVGPSKLEDPVKTAVAAAARQFDSTVCRHVAAAYRQGQEEMREMAYVLTNKLAVHSDGRHSLRTFGCCDCAVPIEDMCCIADEIRAIPLKEKP